MWVLSSKKILKNNDFKKFVDTSDEWIFSRTGIKQRHIAEKEELTSDLAIKASQNALDSAKLKADKIDCIIIATTTPDETFPSTATKVQNFLKFKIYLHLIFKQFVQVSYILSRLLILLLKLKMQKEF